VSLEHLERIFTRDQSDSPDGFVAGNYLHNRRGHVAMPVRVWWGPPIDPETGITQDRSPRWNITIAGDSLVEDERDPGFVPIARLEDVWPRCIRGETTISETAYRQARVEYARAADPDDPFGHPQGRLDLLTATIPN
jgi:hypothetical protein